jgi:hypothetical protein
MLGRLCLVGTLPLLLLAGPVLSPVLAATNAAKMETCKFGADNDKLAGAKRDAFIKRCMAGGNYEPAARKEALKKTSAKKPTAAAKPAAAPEPADEEPAEKE